MEISPKHLEETFKADVDYYEELFDKSLCNRSITKGQSISLDVPTGFNLSHFAILKQRYINAGWSDVTYNSDQREGTWLTFKY